MTKACQCSECLGHGPDSDSQIARAYKRPTRHNTLLGSTATESQVRFIASLAKRLTKSEASTLIQGLQQQVAR